jgi:competence ComEA-like helix-hairpin-helix protein
LLVENGFGRAHGAKREGVDGTAAKRIQQELQNLESEAMVQHKGIWAATDSSVIGQLRAQEQEEERELKDIQRASAGKKSLTGPVDLNTGTTAELQSISGVGPVLAGKIIAHRPYKSTDDLLRVTGIGPKLLERIRPSLVVNAPPEPAEGSK